MANKLYPDLDNNFPDQVDDFDRFQDISLTSKPYIDQYYTLLNAGKFDELNEFYDNNKSILSPRIINAAALNRLQDGVISTQRYYLSDVQKHVIDAISDRGSWSDKEQYSKLNVVDYKVEGITLMFMVLDGIQEVPIGTPPTDTNYWKQLTIVGRQGVSGVGLSPRGKWDGIVKYTVDDMVAWNNGWWQALADNWGEEPYDGSPYWSMMAEFSGTTTIVPLTSYEEWLQLKEEGKLEPGKYYSTPDDDPTYLIDDTSARKDRAYSSLKTQNMIDAFISLIESDLSQLEKDVDQKLGNSLGGVKLSVVDGTAYITYDDGIEEVE